jgi:hypothetical protein
LAKYFCPLSQGAPDPTLPMGSPVLDYLVTGIDENIQHVSSALRGHASTTEQGRSKMSASDRLQSTVDDGMPAQAVANWVQCENPKCLKWRKLPWHVDVDLLPEKFFCKDNIWNPKSQNCDAIEDEWDMGDAPIKFDTNDEKFEVGGVLLLCFIRLFFLNIVLIFILQRGLTFNVRARWVITKHRWWNSISSRM